MAKQTTETTTAPETGFLVTPNFDQVQDRVGEGIYKARVTDSKVDTWAGKDGKPATTFIAWTMETFGEGADKNNGRRIFYRTPIEGPGAFRLQDFYRAAMGEECPSTGFARDMLYGRELEVTVGLQKDKPEYTEVKSVKPISH